METPQQSGKGDASVAAIILVVSLFFLWGLANNLNDILIKQFKKAFELTDLEASLVQSAFYTGYFLLAIPASICMRRLGYKGALLIGLALYAVGAFLFYPAAALHRYVLFLLALFIIACGLSFLETSANPLVTVLGDPSRATWRLNLAQAFNPLGSICGILIGQHFIFSGIEYTPSEIESMTALSRNAYYLAEGAAVGVPYICIGCVVLIWAGLIARVRFPAVAKEQAAPLGLVAHIRQLAKNGGFVFAVVAQFFYVGAQVGIWSFLIRYTQSNLPGTPEKSAANVLTASLVAFVAGRFIATAVMRYVRPAIILCYFAAINILLTSMSVIYPSKIGVWCLVAVSFFMSVMFPTIFALGIRRLEDYERKLASAFLVMAIVGGAVLTAVMGAASDKANISRAMIVPALCFVVVLCFALISSRSKEPLQMDGLP